MGLQSCERVGGGPWTRESQAGTWRALSGAPPKPPLGSSPPPTLPAAIKFKLGLGAAHPLPPPLPPFPRPLPAPRTVSPLHSSFVSFFPTTWCTPTPTPLRPPLGAPLGPRSPVRPPASRVIVLQDRPQGARTPHRAPGRTSRFRGNGPQDAARPPPPQPWSLGDTEASSPIPGAPEDSHGSLASSNPGAHGVGVGESRGVGPGDAPTPQPPSSLPSQPEMQYTRGSFHSPPIVKRDPDAEGRVRGVVTPTPPLEFTLRYIYPSFGQKGKSEPVCGYFFF